MGRGTLKPHEEKLRQLISSNIKRLLNENGLKAIDLKRGTGLPQSSISEYINGKSTPNLGKVEQIAEFFGVDKSDIDPSLLPDWDELTPSATSPLIDETIETMKQLDEARQQVVLATANVQLKEQNDSKAKVIPMKKKSNVLTDEALQEAVDTAVAFDGIPLNEQEKEAAKALIRRFWEEDHPED
ncbi:helix-turn-helix domain-containing protein [Lactococcus garvieae]|uniref:helix-turn-helix domain-containing protein n=1 Tax=Lactococcus garvieae TaxID=1363 RepID=UPI001F60FA57|nr:helix-turn-helix transcriptional regulator [Lactococcus garvieae]MCI3861104.1 helix-turn-helix domain-containing protein [Lactococcus garvieae]